MAPEVRMRRPIRYKPKDPVKPINAIRPTRTTVNAMRPTMINPIRTTLKAIRPIKPTRARPRQTVKLSPNLMSMNLRGNMLYDPRQPSPKIEINSNKLFDKIRELQEMLNVVKRKRNRDVSMNRTAKKYLNNTSYEDTLLNASYIDPMNDIKLKGVKGTAFG